MRRRFGSILLGLGLLVPQAAQAHFQELIPSSDIIAVQSDRTVSLDIRFTHPMERGPVMAMGQPVQFGVLVNERKSDLRPSLTTQTIDGKLAFEARHVLKSPGDYVFFIEPAPYWEPAERKYIVHMTKVVVDFGSGQGWDQMVGLPVEIEPLVRPYGLWTGNQFRGIVRQKGKPVPFAEIEVEWKNDGSVTAPSDPFVTQIIKADSAGQFSYTLPRAGWWGFAALIDGDNPMMAPDGKPASVELGALMWVKATDMR